jgi:transposase-like protein
VSESRTYPAEVKAQAIVQWKAGASLNQLAAQTGAPKSTVRRWLAGHVRTPRVSKRTETNGLPSTEELDRLAWREVVGNFDALESLRQLIAEPHFRAGEGPNPRGVAVLFGVISDKQIRFLAALRAGGSVPPGDIDGRAELAG